MLLKTIATIEFHGIIIHIVAPISKHKKEEIKRVVKGVGCLTNGG